VSFLERMSVGVACVAVVLLVLNVLARFWVPAVLMVVLLLSQGLFLWAKRRERRRNA
jgi:hypothetical protein